MGQTLLVTTHIEDGRRFVDRLIAKGIPIFAAGWVKADETDWYLYLVSPIADDGSPVGGYPKVNAVLLEMPDPFWVDFGDTKLIAPTSKVGEAILRIQAGYTKKVPIRYGGPLGSSYAESAIFYSLATGAPLKEPSPSAG